VFEVGCGAGAFLYPFYQQGNRVFGIDYSANLVKIALDVMPQAAISVGEAIDMPLKNQFNVVVSNGVFLYFPSYEYAAIVLQHMLQIATKCIGIFDVPDLSQKEEAISRRKALIGEAEYEQNYRGIEHIYYNKDWFYQLLANEPVKVTIEDQYIRDYGNSQYRFNVFISKNL
jgi:trans-aconitate methyltransferase